MTILALPQQTAEWLLSKPAVIDQLHQYLCNSEIVSAIADSDFAEGPIRMSLERDGRLLMLWHTDYLSGTGAEHWGFIELHGDCGVLRYPDISMEVLERCLYVTSQRLQGLFIDGAFIHRKHANGAHTCLAGRGTLARQKSVGYAEREVHLASSSVHSIVCIGPEYDLQLLAISAAKYGERLPALTASASEHLSPTRRKPVAPPNVLPDLRTRLAVFFEAGAPAEYDKVHVNVASRATQANDIYRSVGWTFADWLKPTSSLSPVQRRLLQSEAYAKHPIRIVGPGGSGKTLLMQLLALDCVQRAHENGRHPQILYLAHNAKMADTVRNRFSVLAGSHSILYEHLAQIQVLTLAEYGQQQLQLDDSEIIDRDAQAAKEFQYEVVEASIEEAFARYASRIDRSPLFSEVRRNTALRPTIVRLLTAEISTAIKGHGLTNDERRYVRSEKRLTRLHGILGEDERQLVFEIFKLYHTQVFEQYRVLDPDDLALSLLGRLRAPIWDLKRRDLGYDHVFVDEAQLFNENERRIFPLLTKSNVPHVPIVLALDEAQDTYGQTTAGLASLGIENVASENLSSIHRSTRAIVRLAFFVIQRSTDLFGADFPDYTGIAEHMDADDHPLATPPSIDTIPSRQDRFGKFVVKQIRELRRTNIRRIVVICHAEQYWQPLLDDLRRSDLPLLVLETRGEIVSPTDPAVVLTRPAYVGGQEFDAALLVGLESGLVPPRVQGNEALSAAVEQQSLREIYLSITRARFQLRVLLAQDAVPTSVLADAERAGLLRRTPTATE